MSSYLQHEVAPELRRLETDF